MLQELGSEVVFWFVAQLHARCAHVSRLDNEVPLSVMMKDMLTTYKLGWKTSYYQNTYDFKGDDEVKEPEVEMNGHSHMNGDLQPVEELEGEECEACNI